MFKIYQKYFINSFLTTLGKISLVFLVLIFILNIFEEINFFKDEDVNFYLPLLLTFLNSSSIFYDILPFTFLITTQFFFINLIEKNELILLKNYGLNNFKIINVLSLISLILGIFIITVFYNLSANMKFLYLDLKNNYATDNKYLAVITDNGLWIKDEINQKTNIISANNIQKDKLTDVEITQFDQNFDLIKTFSSKEADVSNNTWILMDVEVANSLNNSNFYEQLNFETNFNSTKINNLYSNLSSLSLWELRELKKNYKKTGYSLKDVSLHIQKIYAYPIYLTIMTILSSIVMLNIKINRPKIFNLILGILISVIIYYISCFFVILGANEKISILASVWAPLLIIVLVISIGLVRINEK